MTTQTSPFITKPTGFTFGQTNNAGLFGRNQNTSSTGGGLFGNTSNNPGVGGMGTSNKPGSLFGGGSIGTSGGSGGLFNNNNTLKSNMGGLFENKTSQIGAVGGLYNNNNIPQSGGGLFGNTSQPSMGGSLFGNTSQPGGAGGLFGNNHSQQSGGLFGNNSTPQQSGGGLFGNNTASQLGSGGGLFGNNTSQQPGVGLFANNSPQTGGLFGHSNPQSGGGGIFGNSAVPQPGVLFGNKTTQPGGIFGNTNTSTGGLFGNNNPQGGNLFGNTGGTMNTPQTGLFAGNSIIGRGNTGSTGGQGLFGTNNLVGGGGNNSSFNLGRGTNQPQGGLFGTNMSGNPNTGSGLFGGTLAGTNNNTGGAGLFGNLGKNNAVGVGSSNPFSFGNANSFGGGNKGGFIGGGSGFVQGANQNQSGLFSQNRPNQLNLNNSFNINNNNSILGRNNNSNIFGNTNTNVNNIDNRQQQHELYLQMLTQAVSFATVFGDERDNLIKKFNQLQAYWGLGTGVIDSQGNAVEFKKNNPFSLLKTIGYVEIPTGNDNDGYLYLVVDKSESDMRNMENALIANLQQLIDLTKLRLVKIESINGLPESKQTEVQIYVTDPQNSRVSSSKLVDFFSRKQIELSKLSIKDFFTRVRPSKEQFENYLNNPPSGTDPNAWAQAIKDNPKPEKLIVCPIFGFTGLKQRVLAQRKRSERHKNILILISNDVTNLKQNQTNLLAKLEQTKRKQIELSRRLLKIMVGQEINRKSGYSMQENEENIRIRFEAIQNELNSPNSFRAQLSEMMSQMRTFLPTIHTREIKYKLDEDVIAGVQLYLKEQQDGISHLVKVINEDVKHLNLLEERLTDK